MIFLFSIPAAIAGFIVASSMAASLSENAWWLLGAGLGVSMIGPAIISSWVRNLRRPRHDPKDTNVEDETRPRALPRHPTTSFTVLVLNAAMIAGLSTLAPAQTHSNVKLHGAWWVREMATNMDRPEGDPLIARGEEAVAWLASLIPAGQGDAVSITSGLPPASDGGTGPELAPDMGLERADGLAPPEEVQVSFQKKGSAVVVPVKLRGPAGEAQVNMIFDTGATITTVNQATLDRIGLVIDASAPTVQSHTANGVVVRRLGIIEGAELGRARVLRGLTVSLCDVCAKPAGRDGEKAVVGLLGLNFSRNFLVTMDHEAGRIGLKPKTPAPDHTYDAQHFVRLENARGIWRGATFTVDLVVHNKASRALRNVEVSATVDGATGPGVLRAKLAGIPARGTRPLHMSGKLPSRGRSFKLKLEKALW